jgi:hypothetical protein
VRARPGIGLAGDRSAEGRGYWSPNRKVSCALKLAGLLGLPIVAPLVHRGGLRADVLSEGEIVEGATIRIDTP